MEIKKVFENVSEYANEHSSDIFFGVGIGCGVAAVALMGVFSPKAYKAIEEKKNEQNVDKLSVVDTIKTAGKFYILPILSEVVSIVCLSKSRKDDRASSAALATALAIREAASKTYVEKVKEVLGDKKEHEVQALVDKEQMEKSPFSRTELIVTPKGTTICYDPWSDRYFTSDREAIKKAENEINRDLRDELFVPLNELYYRLGLKETEAGKLLGFDMDKGYLEITFTSQLTEDGTDTPVRVLNYEVFAKPKYY